MVTRRGLCLTSCATERGGSVTRGAGAAGRARRHYPRVGDGVCGLHPVTFTAAPAPAPAVAALPARQATVLQAVLGYVVLC